MKKIIAVAGLISSGKDTASRFLIENHGYVGFAFADALKDCLATIFQWPRHLLEGDSLESREWRNTVDDWWSTRLGIPDFTPRKAMQNLGTDVMRRHFHDELWIANVERRIHDLGDRNIVITDARFPNELLLPKKTFSREFLGTNVWISRGELPQWYATACLANSGDSKAKEAMLALGVHQSEWALAGYPFDNHIRNDSTLDALSQAMARLV